ncbi:hypothetical protein GGI11_000152 [Coemansia sp. RSA 2049]|nr:hypothetical protein GGI11_000152 [Coemansia sp. RSA 2049]
MDDFMIRLATDAAEAEDSSGAPKKEEKGPAAKAEAPQGPATTSEEEQQLPEGTEPQPGATADQPQQQQQQQEGEEDSGGAQPFGSSMFGFAASWGKRLQNELHLDQLVDQVKRQSEEVTRAYRDDITEFAQAVRVGAVRGMDELSTRFEQMKTELGAEFQQSGEDTGGGGNATERQAASGHEGGGEGSGGILQGLGKHFQMDALKLQQERAKRLMDRLGTELEDLLRDAIVIEAPGSAGTEEQKSAARKIIYDRRMAQLAAIQESEDTYLVDPATKEGAGGSSDFAAFAKEFGLDETRQEDADLLLKENPAMAALHTRLVPEKVADSVFWTRYFFHAWMIDQKEMRRKKLVEAAVAATEEDQFSWDLDEEEDAGKVKAEVKQTEKEKEKEKSAESPETSQPKDSVGGSSEVAVEEGAEKTEQEAPKEKPAKTPSQKEASKAEKDGGNGNDDDAWGEWE